MTDDGIRDIIVVIPERSVFEYLIGRRRVSNVPADAKLVRMWIDVYRGQTTKYLALRMTHPSFDVVTVGRRIPFVKARFAEGPLADA